MSSSSEDGQPVRLPIACTLGPDDGPARLARWAALHASDEPVTRLVGQTLEVRYGGAPGVLTELQQLALAEQSCCSFLDWQVSEEAGQPVLRVTGSGDSLDGLASVAGLFGATVDVAG